MGSLSWEGDHHRNSAARGDQLAALQQKTTTANVLEVLRDAILNGVFPPGSALREVSIARELGISRAPLREALLRLSDEGLIERIPYRGSFVTNVSAKHITEIAGLRKKLELMAVELAFPHLDELQMQRFRDDIEHMRKAAKSGDLAESTHIHMRFHRRFYELADHSLLLSIWDSWQGQLQLFFSLDHRMFDDLHELVTTHERLIEVIEARDLPTIEAELARHVHGLEHLGDKRLIAGNSADRT